MPTLPTSACYGCWACENICPKTAISMVENDEGFFYPRVDDAQCVLCGSCERVCPSLQDHCPVNRSADPATWVAWSSDYEERNNSSSGGLFSVLAKHNLARGGVVFGAGFGKDWELQHLAIELVEDLHRLQGSKYLQSQIGNAYQKAKAFLKKKRPVLFSGTPCQVAGLYGYLGSKEYQELITCEIICHGVPSPKVFKKYKNEVQQSFGENIAKINFRDKCLGWRNYSLTFESSFSRQKQGKCHRTDDFMRLFLSNICLRKSCPSCGYARLPRVADITLGDYWNITVAHPDLPNDDSGVSVIICNSSAGDDLLAQIGSSLYLAPSTLSKAVAGNKCLVSPSIEHKKRNDFFAMLDRKSVANLRRQFCKKTNIILRIILKIYRMSKLKFSSISLESTK